MGIQEDGLGTEGQPTPDTAAGLLADLDAAHDEAGRDRRPLADAAPQPAAPLAVPEPAVAAAAADRPAQSAAAAKAGGVSWGEMPPSPSEELPPDTPTTAKSDAGSEASSGAASSISPHYDDKRDVILKMEHLGEKEIKSMILGVWGTLLVGVALLGVVLWIKLSTDKQDYLQNSVVPSVNVAFASALVAGMATCWVLYARRVARAVASGKRWSARRLRAVQLTSAEVSLQLVNSIFFLVPNGYVLSHDCAWFNPLVHWSGWVRWTCWNTLFLLFWVQGSSTSPLKGRAATPLVLVIVNAACLIAYAALYLRELRLAYRRLAARPYTSFRMGNLVVRLQARGAGDGGGVGWARLRILAICFFVASSVIYTFVGINTCASYLTSWLGYLPMQLVMSAVAVANARIFMPKRPHDTAILQFAWTERDVPRKREERSSSLPPESLESFCMDCEPMFCLETGIKMMYWSYLDTKCIFGWNSDTVVIAFRGTASLANVKADVQLWRTPYPEGVGRLLLGTAPLVHAGFKAAYTANGERKERRSVRQRRPGCSFNQRLLERLRHILFRCAEAQTEAGSEKPVTVYVTGHVINNDDAVCRGGKFLVLYKRPGHRVLVNKLGDLVVRPSYVETFIRRAFFLPLFRSLPLFLRDTTFSLSFFCRRPAQSRVGRATHALPSCARLRRRFAYRAATAPPLHLPSIQCLANSHEGKLPGAGSVRDHLLTSYQRALTAVLAAQFGSKMVDGGREGALQLAQEAGTREAMLHLGSRKASGASPEPSKDLEEVVVADGAGGGKEAPGLGQQAPPQAAMQPEVRHEAPRPEQQPAAQAAAEQQPAAQAAAGQQQPAAGQKAGEAPPGEALPPSFTHERQLRVRQCGARRQCRTMCQVLARRAHARGGAGGGGAPPPKGLSPMCDIPTEREELRSAQQAGEGLPRMSGAAVLGLEPSPSGEAQPEHEGTARGRVASFPLILSPAPSSPLGGR
eukprot:scaffold1.g5583.t1